MPQLPEEFAQHLAFLERSFISLSFSMGSQVSTTPRCALANNSLLYNITTSCPLASASFFSLSMEISTAFNWPFRTKAMCTSMAQRLWVHDLSTAIFLLYSTSCYQRNWASAKASFRAFSAYWSFPCSNLRIPHHEFGYELTRVPIATYFHSYPIRVHPRDYEPGYWNSPLDP